MYIWPRVPCYICVLICFVFRNISLIKAIYIDLLGENNRQESSKFTLVISICVSEVHVTMIIVRLP